MRLTNNTILITGGGSGIGRGLAEQFFSRGNTVIIAGRRRAQLDEVTAANPGMHAIELDVADPASIAAVAQRVIADHPTLNVLINNAGIMRADNAASKMDDAQLAAIVTTNLLGPIRMTSALIEHLKTRDPATIVNVTSGLAYVPLATSAVYSATKSALHAYTLAQRYLLAGTPVRMQEIVPPWVQTDLMGGKDEPRAMPLPQFIAETMAALETDAAELPIGQAAMLRGNVGPNEHAFVTRMNDMAKG